jgi:thiamine transport system substrate-binding protein
MKKIIYPILILAFLALALAGCAQELPKAGMPTPIEGGGKPIPPRETPVNSPAAATPVPAGELTLVTHDSFDASEEVIKQFQDETGIKLNILKSGDAGEMLNTLLLSKEAPLGDVVYGIDNAFLSRALAGGLFAPYAAPALSDIPDHLKLDPENRLLPVDYGYVTLNYDIKWFEEHNLAPPTDIADLIDPAYKGLTVVENPASSSPGLAFLLTTIWRYGDIGEYTYLNYWRDLKANDVLVTDGWSDAYFGQFTVGSGGEGERPIVVSYATSPAAEVFFNELDAPPSASVNTPGNSFEQVEFVGILANSRKQEAARKLVDFLLSPAFQEDIPQHMWVYPANSKAKVGDLFEKWAEIPADPVRLAPDEIAAKRESWIEDWTDVMLRQ